MSKWRKCVFGCEKFRSLFSLPKEEPSRHKWLEFIFGRSPRSFQQIFVCDRHFTDDSIVNLGLYLSGLSWRLNLRAGAIPTIRPDGEATGTSQETSREAAPSMVPRVRSVAVQTTTLPMQTRTVSTQLSANTLMHHGKGPCQRPSKRPRLEEEESVENMDVSTETSVTDVSEVSEKEPSGLEDSKYIVFESRLREIFSSCPVCQSRCDVKRRKYGTFVSFVQKCPLCHHSRTWDSGPLTGSTPDSDLQLSAAVYFTGASFGAVTKICKAMNLQIHNYNTFRKHSRCFLEPVIRHKWNEDQKSLFEDLKKKGKLAVGGDMSSVSPGHSSKYGAYSLMDLQSEKIVDMKLVQSTEVRGRSHMEKEGLRRSLDFVEENGLKVDSVVTERQPQIHKFLRERKVTQFYDAWRFVKGLSKRLEKSVKNKESKLWKKCFSAVRSHLFCSVSSSKSGPEAVAKWTSLLKDPHQGFPPDSKAVKKLLMNKRVIADVSKLSSRHQTSSLQSFHRVILRFIPKTADFRRVDLMCRLYLAGMHQNENAKQKRAAPFPKYKGKLKPVDTKTSFGYVSALMSLVFTEACPGPTVAQTETKDVWAQEHHQL